MILVVSDNSAPGIWYGCFSKRKITGVHRKVVACDIVFLSKDSSSSSPISWQSRLTLQWTLSPSSHQPPRPPGPLMNILLRHHPRPRPLITKDLATVPTRAALLLRQGACVLYGESSKQSFSHEWNERTQNDYPNRAFFRSNPSTVPHCRRWPTSHWDGIFAQIFYFSILLRTTLPSF